MKIGSAVLLITLLMIAPLFAPISKAQIQTIGGGLPKPFINITETNATVVVENSFNEIIINKSSNIISALILNRGDYKGTRVNPMKLPAIDLLYAFNNTVVRVEWKGYNVLKDSGDRVRIILNGAIENNNLTITLLMSSYRPYIDIVLNMPQLPGFYYLVFPVNKTIIEQWVLGMSYYSGQGLTTVTMNNLTMNPTGYGLDALAILGVMKENQTSRLDLVFGYSNLPGYISPIEAGALISRNVSINPYNKANNTFLIVAAYGAASQVAGIRATFSEYDPYAVLATGLEEPVKAAYPRSSRDYQGVVFEAELLDRLNQTINLMKNRLKNITEENEALKKNLSECTGCKSYWSNELKVMKYQVKRLQERLRNDGILAVGVFILGIILGFGGGYYIVEGQRKRIGVRRR